MVGVVHIGILLVVSAVVSEFPVLVEGSESSVVHGLLDGHDCKNSLATWQELAPGYNDYTEAKGAFDDLTATTGSTGQRPSLAELETLTHGIERVSQRWLQSATAKIYAKAFQQCAAHGHLRLSVFQTATEAASGSEEEKDCLEQQSAVHRRLVELQEEINTKLFTIVAFHDASKEVVEHSRCRMLGSHVEG